MPLYPKGGLHRTNQSRWLRSRLAIKEMTSSQFTSILNSVFDINPIEINMIFSILGLAFFSTECNFRQFFEKLFECELKCRQDLVLLKAARGEENMSQEFKSKFLSFERIPESTVVSAKILPYINHPVNRRRDDGSSLSIIRDYCDSLIRITNFSRV
ncbi:hypothetical protein RCL1_001301 [Eukaryota sp. TZLM3-RCL]